MAHGKKSGLGGVFWVCFIIFGLLVLIGVFYWMVVKPSPVPHSPAKPNGAVFSYPLGTPYTLCVTESPLPEEVPYWELSARDS